jgi:hypothetical protein
LSGPPPTDLSFRLPNGAKQPLPALVPIQKRFPCWFSDEGYGGVAAGTTVPRVAAATIFCEIARRRLRKRLRTVQAVSYAPSLSYDPLNADTAHLVLFADSDRERRAELTKAFGELFRELGKVEESEVEAARRKTLVHWTGALAPPPADHRVLEVQRAAMDWILGRDFESREDLATELLSVTEDDVSGFGRGMQATAMFAVPGEVWVPRWFGGRAPISTARAVQGDETLSVDAPIHTRRLVHGPDGVSVLYPDGFHRTVRYSELAAALYFEDGGAWLFGLDGTELFVEPTMWRGGQSVVRKIRERVPAHLVLDERSRPTDAIPRPRTTAWQRFRARLTRR